MIYINPLTGDVLHHSVDNFDPNGSQVPSRTCVRTPTTGTEILCELCVILAIITSPTFRLGPCRQRQISSVSRKIERHVEK